MSAANNKQLLQHIFSELAQGNTQPFADSMAEDFCWTITGTTPWSKTYRGKQAVRRELLRPLFAQFADRYTTAVQRIIAEGEHVVVEARGRVTTKKGKPYNNTYCYVFRVADGQLKEVTEYFDTQLVATALEPPALAPAA